MVALLLTLGLTALQLTSIEQRYLAIIGFVCVAAMLSIWSLHQDLRQGSQWITSLILPVMYPSSVALFYFLLPEQLLLRVLLLGLFGIGMYALLLTENIYVVAAVRTIQLIRAAHAVGFLLTIATCVLLVGTLLSYKLPLWFNAIGTILILFFLFLRGLSAAKKEETQDKSLWTMALASAGFGGELVATLGLLPMAPLVAAIVVSGYLYVALGLEQQYLEGRLFGKTINEYLTVGAIVFIAALAVTFYL